MAEHLSNETLDAYRRKTLRGESRFNVDVHLAECQACCEKLQQGEKLQSLCQTVQANLRHATEDLSEHLSDEQFVAYAKNQLNEVEHEIVSSHLVWFRVCKADAEEMIALISHLDYGRGKSRLSWASLREQVQTVLDNSRRFVQVPVMRGAAIMMLALFVPYAIWRWGFPGVQDKEDPSANVSLSLQTTAADVDANPSPFAVSRETAPPSKLPGPAGDLSAVSWLLSGDQRLFERAWNQGELEVSRVIENFTDTNMGAQEKDLFRLLGPGGEVIRETQPTIRWQALEGVTKYRVIVTDISNSSAEVADLIVTGTEWRLDRPLERGHRYNWQIVADQSGKSIYGSWGNRKYTDFFVLTEDELERVTKAETRYNGISDPKAHIALAARYAKAGLVEEAKRELRKFPKGHPQSSLAARLLENLARKTRQ